MPSLGFIGLETNMLGHAETLRLRLTTGQDPLDLAAMQSLANTWATAMLPAVSASFFIGGWRSYNANRDALLSGTVLTPGYGGAGPAIGSGPSESFTGTLVGRSTVVARTGHPGHTLLRWRLYNTVPPPWGGVGINLVDLDFMDSLFAFLRTDPRIWADFYGNKCDLGSVLEVQFNAYYQNHRGC